MSNRRLIRELLVLSVLLAVIPDLSAASRYIGSLQQFKAPVEWRENSNAAPVLLNPISDARRPLYAGNQLRCRAPGAAATLALLGNRREVISSSDWVDVPDYGAHFEAWLAQNMPAAGRSRGTAPARRAVLVGIDKYLPTTPTDKTPARTWTDLDGCVNDVTAMYSLIVAKYGFEPRNVLVLTNEQATRSGILKAIEDQLIESSQPGDVAFFFYAGHGSQRLNSPERSRSTELDNKDETIVPADSWRGAEDIRDKELRKLFNAALDRGAFLTAIFDSCHSGSVARGLPVAGKARHASPLPGDIADPTDFGPAPEERGALVLSAAQDDELAGEQFDAGIAHGAFTLALLRTLRDSAPDRAVAEIFARARTALQLTRARQEPVIAATTPRRRMGLFGETGNETNSPSSTVMVERVKGSAVTLQAGRAIGLHPGCELVRTQENQTVQLEITAVNGLVQSQAKIVKGDPSAIQPGDSFIVSGWVYAPEALLKVWIPPANLSFSELRRLTENLRPLLADKGIHWVKDPTEETPTHVIEWNGTNWSARAPQRAELIGDLTVESIRRFCSGGTLSPKLLLILPPSKELDQALAIGEGRFNALKRVTSPAEADYLMVGSLQESLRYCWIRPDADRDLERRCPLPSRSDWLDAGTSGSVAAAELRELAGRMGRLKAWLTLDAPATSRDSFPYRLALKRASGAPLVSSDAAGTHPVTIEGEEYSVVLQANPDDLKRIVPRRFVYVFTIDRTGRGQLLWPPSGQGNSEKIPPEGGVRPEIPLPGSEFNVGDPLGLDTYILVTTDQAIADTSIFDFEGVRTERRGGDGLTAFLGNVGLPTRAGNPRMPANWSIERISVFSKPGQGAGQ